MVTATTKRDRLAGVSMFIVISTSFVVGISVIFSLVTFQIQRYESDYAEAVHQAHKVQTAAALLSVGVLNSYAKIAANDKKGLASALNLLNQQSRAIQRVLAGGGSPSKAFARHAGFQGATGLVRLSASVDAVIEMITNLKKRAVCVVI
ncbi:MAG: hypothetical protein JXQ99_29070 [Hyphomicrobiaceae bacterium]